MIGGAHGRYFATELRFRVAPIRKVFSHPTRTGRAQRLLAASARTTMATAVRVDERSRAPSLPVLRRGDMTMTPSSSTPTTPATPAIPAMGPNTAPPLIEWETVRQDGARHYLLNKYRVLLTRAREGMVIWVPPGDRDDPTRAPALLDATAAYLTGAGVAMLE